MKNKKRNTKLKKNLATLSLAMALLFIPSETGQAFDFFGKKRSAELSKDDIELIQDVYNSIQENYIEDVDKEQLLEGALKGMVQSVGDPYSEYLNNDESQDLDDSVDGSFTGIGVQFEMRNDEPTIVSAIDNTPASEAGLLPNDVILEAEGKELIGLNTNEIVNLIRGPEGTEVDLKIKRGSNDFNVTIERAEIPLISVEAEIDKNNKEVAKVKISQFNGTTYDELVSAIKKMREEGAKSFVFDLRYNPGGLLDQALKISNIFLEDGDTIMKMESRSEEITYTADSKEYGDFKVTEPYVVLINEGSASASEILAATIQENTDNLVVGETSFGKGSVQTVMNESDAGELKLTIARWLTPDGNWIHEEGVKPDQEIKTPEINQAVLMPLDEEVEKGDGSAYSHSLALILEALGYPVEAREYFDQTMEDSLKVFQKDHDLKETGKIDEDTARKLNDAAREYLKENDQQYTEAVEVLTNVADAGSESDQAA